MTRAKNLDLIGTECFGIEKEFHIIEIKDGCIEITCDGIDTRNDNIQMVDTIKEDKIYDYDLIIKTEMEFKLLNVIGIIHEYIQMELFEK